MPEKKAAAKDEVLLTDGTLIHSRLDWPCARCRPGDPVGFPVAMLCVDCASEMVERSVTRSGHRPGLNDLLDLLVLLHQPQRSM